MKGHQMRQSYEISEKEGGKQRNLNINIQEQDIDTHRYVCTHARMYTHIHIYI